MYRQTGEQDTGEQPSGRGSGVLVDGKLNMSQQCPGSQEGHPCPGGHQAQHHQPGKGGDCPALLCTGAASARVLGAGLGATTQKSH